MDTTNLEEIYTKNQFRRKEENCCLQPDVELYIANVNWALTYTCGLL